MLPMEIKSILIKDTTREEREQIIRDALEQSYGCDDSNGMEIDYQQYIDGKKELRQLNEEYRAATVKAALVNRDQIQIENNSGCGAC